MTKRIGIDINGVLRDTITKFGQLYEKHLIESDPNGYVGKTYNVDISGNTELEVSDIIPFEYKKLTEVDSLDLTKHFAFRNSEELFSFMYEEYSMELFGHAPSTEMTTFNMLNDLYLELRDENELMIVSSEIGKSKPSSLFFLSKFGCLLEKIFFFSEITKESMWDQVDILLTADPILLLDKHKGKVVVKYVTDYNKHIKSEYEIFSLSEFNDTIKTIKQNV
jgi:hypothetical protein